VSEVKHVDLDRALQWLEGDERMLERIRQLFMRNIPEQMRTLKEALDAGDLALVERMAHTIKGSASMMGALMMSQQAAVIEQYAMKRELAEAQGGYGAIADEYVLVMEALRALGEQA
jgi:HPt (histidine-containing phosphotransfer) domain-containing protein